MKKIATGAVFLALVLASGAQATTTISTRPKATTADTATLASTLSTAVIVPAVSQGDPNAFNGYTATNSSVADPKLYGGLLSYFNAELTYEGALYQSVVKLGGDSAALDASYGALNKSLLNLIAYLQTTVTNA